MRTDKTQKLASHLGQYVRLNYNVTRDPSKPAMMFGGTLRVYKTHFYEIRITGGTWIRFDDDNIENVWVKGESYPYIELKV